MKSKNASVVTTFPVKQERSPALQAILATPRGRAAQVAKTVRDMEWGSPLPAATSLLKRVIDVVGALVGLGIVAALMLPIAIAIRVDTPGPLIFRQVRYGYQGKPFLIWKFRSMVADADANQHQVENESKGLIFKNKKDPRVTKVGRFLRRTSLDELPQFVNVLRGEMSLVGTRPPILNEVIQYQPYHWRRLAVKPGMTGKWQTSGRSNVTDFEDIVAMDLDYQANWSIWRDLGIIFKTVTVVFGSKDAC